MSLPEDYAFFLEPRSKYTIAAPTPIITLTQTFTRNPAIVFAESMRMSSIKKRPKQ
jgi:hypothetical protein